MSSTVDKALELLNHFNQNRMRIGLSELARLARIDKATAYRLLTTLTKHGLIEQENDSRAYRLGAATLRLARIREASLPVTALVTPIIEGLAEKTGETAHAALLAGHSLATIGIVNSKKSLHVSLDAGERLPLHATASGIACLAFLPADDVTRLLKGKLQSFTQHTSSSTEKVLAQVEVSRAQGFSESDQGYEVGVYGIAAPVFSAEGFATGTVAVATPTQRMTKELRIRIIRETLAAAADFTRRLGAELPKPYVSITKRLAA
jgi:IclR family acetate operon transcriptional repressor